MKNLQISFFAMHGYYTQKLALLELYGEEIQWLSDFSMDEIKVLGGGGKKSSLIL